MNGTRRTVTSLMQPYFFPYLGYFDLLCHSDTFVFYDDASFSKNGWYNRNRIYNDKQDWEYIRVSLRKAPLGTACTEIVLADKAKDRERLLRQLAVYRTAPFYNVVVGLVEEVFDRSGNTLADIAVMSIVTCARHIGLTCNIARSSEINYDRKQSAFLKIVDICRLTTADTYLNSSGGRSLYCSTDFRREGLELLFTPSHAAEYVPVGQRFVPYLSILDAMMWVGPETLRLELSKRIPTC
ncbi:WbqC family protein [Agrobacterium salinitolerans]|uniref:WbqC family protein n=1 Tax=Agrobacterium salinitolerans TaxID=1183413 RepID=A0A4Z1QWW1_9HYPH|nr:WbqC family protein [Agrobacterium salinitolerans]UYZ09255.1 WbqC family protein [Agrobacterium salinitolerans]